MSRGRGPRRLFHVVAVAEAVTWALLLVGMVLKHVVEVTDLGVRVFGMAHGVVFLAYCLVTVLVAVDARWSAGRTVLGLAAAVPPFLTLWFERYAAARDAVPARWRLVEGQPDGAVERVAAWLLRHPAGGAAAGAAAVGALTGVALLVGPPAG